MNRCFGTVRRLIPTCTRACLSTSSDMSDQSLPSEESRQSSSVDVIDSLPKEGSTQKRDSTPPLEQSSSKDESSARPRDDTQSRESTADSGFGFTLSSLFPNFLRSYSTYPDGDHWEKLPLEEKRRQYTCGPRNYVTLSDIKTWQEETGAAVVPSSPTSKLSLWRGDITKLEIDAIVNAANSSLLGGGGVDGAIHRAAGPSLQDECRKLGGCAAGDAKLTRGHRLPAKYILHTVGPMNGSEETLTSCYESCLKCVEEHHIRSVAFSCVSTGIYGFPNKDAAHIALNTVKKWLKLHGDKVHRIIFCVFLEIDYRIYRSLIPEYFPPERRVDEDDGTKKKEAATTELETTDDSRPQEGAADDSMDIADEADEPAVSERCPGDSQTETVSDVPLLQRSVSLPARCSTGKDEAVVKKEVGGIKEDHPPQEATDDNEMVVVDQTDNQADINETEDGSLSQKKPRTED